MTTPNPPAEPVVTQALLPCPNPWCRYGPIAAKTNRPSAKGHWYVICGCGVESPPRPDHDDAIKVWNTRSTLLPATDAEGLVGTARRNLRHFIQIAAFKCEADREAARNCLDVLEQEIDGLNDLSAVHKSALAAEASLARLNRPVSGDDVGLSTVARRNLRYFINSATFKCEVDREAALNCLGELEDHISGRDDQLAVLRSALAAEASLAHLSHPADGRDKELVELGRQAYAAGYHDAIEDALYDGDAGATDIDGPFSTNVADGWMNSRRDEFVAALSQSSDLAGYGRGMEDA